MFFQSSMLLSTLANGGYGTHGLTERQLNQMDATICNPAHYLVQTGPVRCIDDRFDFGGLAGGAFSLALLYNFISGERRNARLSYDLAALRRLGFKLWLHSNCAAIANAVELIKTHFTGWDDQLFEAQPTYGLGYVWPLQRLEVERWAQALPEDYIDLGRAWQVVKESPRGMVVETRREHKTGYSILVHKPDKVFTASGKVSKVTGGCRPLLVNSWIARRKALLMPGEPRRQELAASVVKAFTLAVMGCLAGSDHLIYEAR